MTQRKSIFITGAASGIGRHTALLFAARGWYVGLADIDAEGLAQLAREIGVDHCRTLALDVTDVPQYRAAILAQLSDPIHGIPEALEAFESLQDRHELARFADDPRAVGEWRIRVTANGQWNLRCDARLPPSL